MKIRNEIKNGIKKGGFLILAAVLILEGALMPERTAVAAETVNMTREEAAVWVCKEMEKRGEKVNEALLEKVKEEKRLSDLSRINKKNREAVLLAYHWGIIAGQKNGAYSKDRSFKGSSKLTKTEWKEIKKRVEQPKKRLKLSPDGQLCRTTKLPANSKKFPYILDSYPNSYYEGTFDYEWYEGKKLVEGKDYNDPANINKTAFINWKTSYPMKEVRGKYEDIWEQKIKENLEARINVDYRKLGGDYKWLNRLRNTYYIHNDPELDERVTRKIEAYMDGIKKNKVIIRGTVDMDSSSLYKSVFGYFMRAHIKFKVVSAEKLPAKQTELLYGEHINLKNLKKGVWKEAIVDIGLGSANGYSDGRDFAVVEDSIIEPLKK